LVFWTTGHIKAKKGHEIDRMNGHKAVYSNYARDLMYYKLFL